MSMINLPPTTPFLEGDIEESLQANDNMTVLSVYIANTQPWYWQCMERLPLLARTHQVMHDLGMEAGNPLHDACVRDSQIITAAIARADTVVWN